MSIDIEHSSRFAAFRAALTKYAIAASAARDMDRALVGVRTIDAATKNVVLHHSQTAVAERRADVIASVAAILSGEPDATKLVDDDTVLSAMYAFARAYESRNRLVNLPIGGTTAKSELYQRAEQDAHIAERAALKDAIEIVIRRSRYGANFDAEPVNQESAPPELVDDDDLDVVNARADGARVVVNAVRGAIGQITKDIRLVSSGENDPWRRGATYAMTKIADALAVAEAEACRDD